MFPVTLDLTGRTVLVVGGGAVGRRKAAAAAAAGAAVRVVDSAAGEPYHPDQLAGAALAFACATPEVNARVVADARARGVWVNSASDPAAGDFTLPAVHRAGGLTVAVSTGGAAPALAARVRDRLADQFGADFAAWVALLNEVRGQVLVCVPDPGRRRALLDSFADWAWLDRLRAEGADAVRAAMAAEIGAGGSENTPARG